MRCMKVVLPEPAMPTQTMATGGFCSAVEDAMVDGVVVEVEVWLDGCVVWPREVQSLAVRPGVCYKCPMPGLGERV
jgi:hypothetical protein